MDERTKEIRQALLGRCVMAQDGTLEVIPASDRKIRLGMQGVSAGWGAVHFFGVTCRRAVCEAKNPVTVPQLEGHMQSVGRLLRLSTAPDTAACLCHGYMSSPILLTAQPAADGVEIAAYTARSLLSSLRCRSALRALKSRLS